MSAWEHFRDFCVVLAIVSLLAWVVFKPEHEKESFESACSKIGGVVAYTALKNEKVCIKERK